MDKTSSYGYTLLELMMAIFILSILISMTTPSFTSLVLGNKRLTTTHQLLGTLNYARTKAIMGNNSTTICSGTAICNGSTIWNNETLTFVDSNRNGQIDQNEDLLLREKISAGYSWHWSNFRTQPFMRYKANGATDSLNGTFTLCHNGQSLQQIVLNAAGRPRLQKSSSDAPCT